MGDLEIRNLNPNELEIDPVNERTSNVNPHSEDGESLQESIKELGVIEPIVVRKKDGQYYVVAGQRRTLAAQAAGVETIPARVMDLDDTEARIVSITENAEQLKKDVPPEDRAIAIKQLLEDGLSFSEIAKRMGFSEPTVRKWVEPALGYWEDTAFEAEEDNDDGEYGPNDISLRAMQIIRKNTSDKKDRENIAKKVVEENVSNKLLKEAADRASDSEEFKEEVERVIKELNEDVSRIRERIRLSGDFAEYLENIMKNRGINEKEAIESLVKERIAQLRYEENGEWIGFKLDDETAESISEVIGDRNVQPKALANRTLKEWLREIGYLDD